MGHRILVVEDEVDLAELVVFNLRQAGHDALAVHEGQRALEETHRHPPDLLVLDVMLPDLSGIEVCRRLRREPATQSLPVLMLTAKGEELDRVVGFEVGADDYVVKPFSPRELVLRVEAILRRSRSVQEPSPEETLVFEPLHIHVAAHRVTVAGHEVSLTALEFKLLLDLARRRGRVQSRDALLERVWGYAGGMETRTVDTHVKRLREKLGPAADHIETVRGIGYRLRDDVAS